MNVVQIGVPKSKVEKYNKLLYMQELNLRDFGFSRFCTVETFTARFNNQIEADIKVCTSEDDLYIDAVLFTNGSQVCVLDPSYELDGTYEFEFENERYIVEIIPAEAKKVWARVGISFELDECLLADIINNEADPELLIQKIREGVFDGDSYFPEETLFEDSGEFDFDLPLTSVSAK